MSKWRSGQYTCFSPRFDPSSIPVNNSGCMYNRVCDRCPLRQVGFIVFACQDFFLINLTPPPLIQFASDATDRCKIEIKLFF